MSLKSQHHGVIWVDESRGEMQCVGCSVYESAKTYEETDGLPLLLGLRGLLLANAKLGLFPHGLKDIRDQNHICGYDRCNGSVDGVT